MAKTVLTGRMDRRTRDINNFIFVVIMMTFFSLVATFVMVFLFGGGDMEDFTNFHIVAMAKFLRTPLFNWEKGKVGLYAGFIVFLLLFCYAYMDYERKRNSRVGEEYGSAKLLTAKDLPVFKKFFFYDPKIVQKYYPKTKTYFDNLEIKKAVKKIPGHGLFDSKRKTAKMEKELFLNSQVMGTDVYLSMNCKFISRNLNTLTIGSSGSGKSYSELFPNILMGTCNYICTDPSGEILAKNGTFLEKICGYKIKVFNTDEPLKSMHYNFIVYIESESDYAKTVEALNRNIKPNKQDGGINEFFDDGKDAFTTALIALEKELWPAQRLLYKKIDTMDIDDIFSAVGMLKGSVQYDILMEKYGDNEKKLRQALLKINEDHLCMQTPRNLMRFCKLAEQKPTEGGQTTSDLDNLFAQLEEHDPRSFAAEQWRAFKVGGPKVCNEIIISATAVFARYFNAEDIEWLTCRDDLHLEELASETPCALFIVTPAANKTYNFLGSMVYTQIFDMVTKMGKQYAIERGEDNPALPRHLSLFLDEFANIGRIPDFLELLSVVRKYNISINIIVQTLAQLKAMYKDSWETVVGNCDTMIFLGGQEGSTIKMLSEKIGKETIKTHNYALGRNGHESYQNQGRSLLEPNEIERMARAHELIFITQYTPIQTTKYDLKQHPNFKYSAECDPKNTYDTMKFARGNDIDYKFLDDHAITLQAVNSFDFASLDVKKGHTKGTVVSDKWRKFTQKDLIAICKLYEIPIEDEKSESAVYGRLLDEYDKQHGTENDPAPVKDKKGNFQLPNATPDAGNGGVPHTQSRLGGALTEEEKLRAQKRYNDLKSGEYTQLDASDFFINHIDLMSAEYFGDSCPEHEFTSDESDFIAEKVNLD